MMIFLHRHHLVQLLLGTVTLPQLTSDIEHGHDKCCTEDHIRDCGDSVESRIDGCVLEEGNRVFFNFRLLIGASCSILLDFFQRIIIVVDLCVRIQFHENSILYVDILDSDIDALEMNWLCAF